jgi:isocitrate/isopropylmalate dehydrogenase
MAKHKIAILPGDGVGKDVVEATMIVLEAAGLDAQYVYGDIGWEFWCNEGDALPARTLRLLRETDCLPLRGHHLQAQGGRPAGAGPRAQEQGPVLFQPHRPPAPGVRPLSESPPLQGLRREPAEL